MIVYKAPTSSSQTLPLRTRLPSERPHCLSEGVLNSQLLVCFLWCDQLASGMSLGLAEEVGVKMLRPLGAKLKGNAH